MPRGYGCRLHEDGDVELGEEARIVGHARAFVDVVVVYMMNELGSTIKRSQIRIIISAPLLKHDWDANVLLRRKLWIACYKCIE